MSLWDVAWVGLLLFATVYGRIEQDVYTGPNLDGGVDNGGTSVRLPNAHSQENLVGRRMWATLPDAGKPKDTGLKLSTEVVLLPGVFDAAGEGNARPSDAAVPRASPYSDEMEDPVRAEKPPCDDAGITEDMSLSDVYGEETANDRMTGGLRGESLAYPQPHPVPQIAIPDQQTITEKCDPHAFERLAKECQACAKVFEANGGCEALADNDVSMMIPPGCGHCEAAAAELCRGGDDKPCPRIRLRGVPAIIPEEVPEYLYYPEKPSQPYTGPVHDRMPCPPPKIRTEKQIQDSAHGL